MPTVIIDKITTDPNLRFEHPRPPRVSAPAIDAALAVAAEAGQRAADAAAEQVEAHSSALRLATRIQNLRTKRDGLAVRLSNLESTDIPGHRSRCEGSVKRLLGISPLDQNQSIELNSGLSTLAALREKVKLLPGIVKDTKSDLASVTAELSTLEGSK